MKGKLIVSFICALLIVPLVIAQPEVKFGGLFYVYSFMWQNADFDSDTTDGDQHFYMHGDVWANADFGNGISAKVCVGDWGTFGRHPVDYLGQEGCAGAGGAHLLEAYLTAANLFETPIGIRVGKQHVLYGDGMVAFDGGEDGITGTKLFYVTPMFDLDLFWYRLVEGGGTGEIGFGSTDIADDHDLFGGYATARFMEGNVGLSPYLFYRTNSWTDYWWPGKADTVYSDNPMWFGARGEVAAMAGLDVKGEFAMMSGTYEGNQGIGDTCDYKGMAYMGELNYSLEEMGVPVTLGGAYVSFSGDDPDTEDENELYESAVGGPYTFGFYKGWPGFGPAHTLRTSYGFALLRCPGPWWPQTVTNLNVINGHLQYATGPVTARADFFMYSQNKAAAEDDPLTDLYHEDQTGLANEIALHLTYNYLDALTFGFAGGYLMPGDYFDNEDAMLGGYIYLAKGF